MRALAVILGVLFSLNSFATSQRPEPSLRSVLNQLIIENDESNPLPQAQSGQLFYFPESKVFELALIPFKRTCPKGKKCAAVMPRPYNEEFKIVDDPRSGKPDGCNIRRYMAVNRADDGSERTLRVIDYSKHNCKMIRAVKPVEATYTYTGPNGEYSQSRLGGQRFTPVR